MYRKCFVTAISAQLLDLQKQCERPKRYSRYLQGLTVFSVIYRQVALKIIIVAVFAVFKQKGTVEGNQKRRTGSVSRRLSA